MTFSSVTVRGQASAREMMRTAVRSPGHGILAAIQRGWLSGLPLEELENCILSYLRATATLCDLEVMDRAIDECQTLLSAERLREAAIAREQIKELLDRLRRSIEKRDVTALCNAIVQCESRGWPAKLLEEAYVAKCQLQQLIGRLRYATGSADLNLLSRVILECASLGLPERDVKPAREKYDQLQALLQQLEAAMQEKELATLNEAINAAEAGENYPANNIEWETRCILYLKGIRYKSVTLRCLDEHGGHINPQLGDRELGSSNAR